MVGPRTFCPVTWICKKQGAVSHSSSEAAIIAMDAAMRLEGLPALILWDLVLDVFEDNEKGSKARGNSSATDDLKTDTPYKILLDVDHVPTNAQAPDGKAESIIMEGNDAFIKMCIKGRSLNLRHVQRTHRVDLEWLFERILQDSAISIKYVNTKQQLADIFTKGSFTESTWKTLCSLMQIWETKGSTEDVHISETSIPNAICSSCNGTKVRFC